MRYLLLVVPLLAFTADHASDRDALLAADRTLSARTASLGMVDGFLPGLIGGGAYLHPGAPLLRGSETIRMFLQSSDTLEKLTWSPVFADVSADGRLGYSYGFVRSDGKRGKYLACWQKEREGWRVVAYARSRTVPVTDSIAAVNVVPSAPVRGRADPAQLISADSLFAAMSVSQGAKPAFLAFAAEDAISFGGGPQLNRGRAAIGAAFDGFPSGAVLAWSPVGAAIAESGDLGCTIGEATIESLHQYSKYLTIWKRQKDGSWKFVADGGNARPAPAP
jgi:ketosteroid isomerase-like protein